MCSTSLLTTYIYTHLLRKLAYIPIDLGFNLHTLMLLVYHGGKGVHSIVVYTISYHNIIVNINVVRYVSVQIMTERYFGTRQNIIKQI